MISFANFRTTQADPTKGIAARLSTQVKETIENNRHILTSIIQTVDFLAKQSLPFRGHRDDGSVLEATEENDKGTSSKSKNLGNFKELLKFRSINDLRLQKHLSTCSKNASYVSKTIQNELVDMLADDVLDQIVQEVRKAQYYSILADEVADVSNKEQLCICLRYVNQATSTIVESFVGMVELEDLTGKTIAETIKRYLAKIGLDIANCRGQGYDGAANMSSSNVGVQKIIKDSAPTASYVHCGSHKLNLVIVKACQESCIRNMMDTVGEISRYFSFSAKRQRLLEDHIMELTSSRKLKLKDVSRTRWIQRHEAFEVFIELFGAIHSCLLAIEEPAAGPSFDRDSKTKASGFRHVLESSTFIVALVVTSKTIEVIKPLSVKLQKQSQDILEAHDHVAIVESQLARFREESVETFGGWFGEAEELASSIQVPLERPRIHPRQKNRANPTCETTEDYFCITIYNEFISHVANEMKQRFQRGQHVQIACHKLAFPAIKDSAADDFEELINFYRDDLGSLLNFDIELDRWKEKIRALDVKPVNIQQCLGRCDNDTFPNLRKLLTMSCVLPVTSCETERGNSRLKLMKTSLRSTMTEQRLSSLMVLAVHRERAIRIDEILERFGSKNQRRFRTDITKW